MGSRSIFRRAVSVIGAVGIAAATTIATSAPAAAAPPPVQVSPPTDVHQQKQLELGAYLAHDPRHVMQFGFPGMPWPATMRGPYIDRVEWKDLGADIGPSLQIHPTRAGRKATGWELPKKAWAEVLRKAPAGGMGGWPANAGGMRAQFDCHWVFARLTEPNKPSWNLEPRRRIVGPLDMVVTRCNPAIVG